MTRGSNRVRSCRSRRSSTLSRVKLDEKLRRGHATGSAPLTHLPFRCKECRASGKLECIRMFSLRGQDGVRGLYASPSAGHKAEVMLDEDAIVGSVRGVVHACEIAATAAAIRASLSDPTPTVRYLFKASARKWLVIDPPTSEQNGCLANCSAGGSSNATFAANPKKLTVGRRGRVLIRATKRLRLRADAFVEIVASYNGSAAGMAHISPPARTPREIDRAAALEAAAKAAAGLHHKKKIACARCGLFVAAGRMPFHVVNPVWCHSLSNTDAPAPASS